MNIYECDFVGLKEYLYDDCDVEPKPAPLGEFICSLLSVNFEGAARTIGSFLEERRLKKEAFPAERLQELVNNLCVTSEFDEMRLMASMMEGLYTNGETREVSNVYGNIMDAFSTEAFECFEIGIVMQAYLEESENNPEMVSAINFEGFVNGFLEMKIDKNDTAHSLSEYSLSQDIFLGCDAKKVVRDVFSNLLNLNGNHSIFALISFDKLLISSVYYFFLNGFRFKRCKNCGRFFVPLSRSDEMYCNSPSPQDKARSCKEYGSQKLWYDRLKNDEVAKLARNVYSAKQMLVRRNPDILAYKEMFEYFKAERKKWERQLKSGEKSRDDYLAWLNKMKARKTL